MTKDMTEGNPLQLILRFSIPLILGNLFQQLYNMADTMIVGKVLGLNALTAVGATSSVNFLIVGFTIGVCNGLAIPVAQKFGAREYGGMRKYVVHIAYIAVALALLLTLLTTFFCGRILTWMKTPDQIIGDSYAYYWVICLGIPFTFLYNTVSGIVRAMGDSRTPFYFLVMSTVLNVILDLFFIITLKMGVAGAAWATVASQAAAGAASFLYMKKKYIILRTTKEERKIQVSYIRILLGNGIPMGLQSSITAIGSIMLQSAVNTLDIVYVSAYAAAMKVKQLVLCPYEAIATGCATFGGQNLGAQKPDRISKGLRAGIRIAMVYTICISVALLVDGSVFALLFVDAGETQVLAAVRKLFFAQGCFFWLLPILNCTRMTIQGLGHSGMAVLAGCSELAARGLMAVFLIPMFGYGAVCFTDQAAWLAATVVCVAVYRKISKRLEGMEKEKKDAISGS